MLQQRSQPLLRLSGVARDSRLHRLQPHDKRDMGMSDRVMQLSRHPGAFLLERKTFHLLGILPDDAVLPLIVLKQLLQSRLCMNKEIESDADPVQHKMIYALIDGRVRTICR